MQECIIQGPLDCGFIVKKLIESEAAFILYYPQHEVRVGFHKGDWTFAKVKGGEVMDYAGLCDAPCLSTVMEIKNPLTKAFLESLLELKNKKEGEVYRTVPALVLESFFEVWGGKYADLEKIEVVKSSRNSYVDEKGKLSVSE